MEQVKNSTNARKWQQLRCKERLKIEIMRKSGKSAAEIADVLGYSKRTLERELKLGMVETRRVKRDPPAAVVTIKREYVEAWEYSAEVAQRKRGEAASAKGKSIKLGKSYDSAEYLEEQIGKEGRSPYGALRRAVLEKKPFAGLVCVKTLYNYIDREYFKSISNKDLW